MTLIYELDLDIPSMYFAHQKRKFQVKTFES